ncbi:hypothetical protein BH10CYA1_BH10CYA1_18100 [soil metagenome]
MGGYNTGYKDIFKNQEEAAIAAIMAAAVALSPPTVVAAINTLLTPAQLNRAYEYSTAHEVDLLRAVCSISMISSAEWQSFGGGSDTGVLIEQGCATWNQIWNALYWCQQDQILVGLISEGPTTEQVLTTVRPIRSYELCAALGLPVQN